MLVRFAVSNRVDASFTQPLTSAQDSDVLVCCITVRHRRYGQEEEHLEGARLGGEPKSRSDIAGRYGGGHLMDFKHAHWIMYTPPYP